MTGSSYQDLLLRVVVAEAVARTAAAQAMTIYSQESRIGVIASMKDGFRAEFTGLSAEEGARLTDIAKQRFADELDKAEVLSRSFVIRSDAG